MINYVYGRYGTAVNDKKFEKYSNEKKPRNKQSAIVCNIKFYI